MNTNPHEKKTDSQIRKQLKAMAAADTPALKPAVSRAGYELTPVPEKKASRPSRSIQIAAAAAACVALAAGVLCLPFLLREGGLTPAGSSGANPPASAPSTAETTVYVPHTYPGEPVVTETVQQGPSDIYVGQETDDIQIKRITSYAAFQEHLQKYPAYIDYMERKYIGDPFKIYSILQWQNQEAVYIYDDLLWVRANVEGGRCQYEVAAVTRTDGQVTVTLRKMAPPEETAAAKKTAWEFFLMIPREELREGDAFTVQFVTDKPRPQAPLTLEKKRELEAAYPQNDPHVYLGLESYYGTYGRCVAVMRSGMAGEAITEQTIAGQYFWYPSTNTISIFRDGQWYSLPHAYDNGWLTAEDVRDINIYYKTGWLSLPGEPVAVSQKTWTIATPSKPDMGNGAYAELIDSPTAFERFWQNRYGDSRWTCAQWTDFSALEDPALYEEYRVVFVSVCRDAPFSPYKAVKAEIVGGALELTLQPMLESSTLINEASFDGYFLIPRDTSPFFGVGAYIID